MKDAPILPGEHIPPGLYPLMLEMANGAMELAKRISRNGLDESLGAAAGVNTDGDAQKALDVIADDLFLTAARRAKIAYFASEEQEHTVTLLEDGAYALAIDPLDGSSNIDTNVSVGTIFAIFPAAATADASFLRPMADLVGGGYFIYGPQTALLVTFGEGVQRYVLDTEQQKFFLTEARVTIPEESNEFAVNASNYRHWPKPIRAYVDDCVAGAEGPRGKNFNMRWIASLVAETHRILARGGIFLYPADDRKGYERGRLRLLYECGPIAMLITQAGGGATDGVDPVLGQSATGLHQRTPLIFGSKGKVARVTAYHDMTDDETNALFGKRGLFRS
ncbi:MAG: class 1 fructose-bisphosphatase [Rhodobacteraceae bacterium]|nr:class 1 fructose-bisphosphatase [Paracoccaceae bacterium]